MHRVRHDGDASSSGFRSTPDSAAAARDAIFLIRLSRPQGSSLSTSPLSLSLLSYHMHGVFQIDPHLVDITYIPTKKEGIDQ